MATPEQIKENKRKLAYLRSLGYNTVPQDGSWGPWQENLWLKATTREKLYPVSPIGLLLQGWDTLTGNNTYRVEHPEGEIRPAQEGNRTFLAAMPVAIAAGRSNPYVAGAIVPAAIMSSLLLGNGPEIIRKVDDFRRPINETLLGLTTSALSRLRDLDGDGEAEHAGDGNTVLLASPPSGGGSLPSGGDNDKSFILWLKDSFKRNSRTTAESIAKFNGNILRGVAIGAGAGAGAGVVLGLPLYAGYRIYKALLPEPSEMEKAIAEQELETLQLLLYKRNQLRLDSLRGELYKISDFSSPTKQDSAVSIPITGTSDGRIIVGKDTITPIRYGTGELINDPY